MMGTISRGGKSEFLGRKAWIAQRSANLVARILGRSDWLIRYPS